MKQINEDYIQNQCFLHFQNTYCRPSAPPVGICFSVPNEAATKLGRTLLAKIKSPVQVRKTIETTLSQVSQNMSAMGLVRGVSDMICIFPKGQLYFVEFKTETGQQRPEQIIFEQNVKALGFNYIVIRSIQQFIEFCYAVQGY